VKTTDTRDLRGAVTRLLAWLEGKPVDVINPEALKVKKA
jgi:hypothetical protein